MANRNHTGPLRIRFLKESTIPPATRTGNSIDYHAESDQVLLNIPNRKAATPP